MICCQIKSEPILLPFKRPTAAYVPSISISDMTSTREDVRGRQWMTGLAARGHVCACLPASFRRPPKFGLCPLKSTRPEIKRPHTFLASPSPTVSSSLTDSALSVEACHVNRSYAWHESLWADNFPFLLFLGIVCNSSYRVTGVHSLPAYSSARVTG